MGTYDQIYAVVQRIPRGRVATYGQVAEMSRLKGQARQVGYALSALNRDGIPWQRVVNARGEISLRSHGGYDELQRELLEAEGVEFSLRGRIDLSRFGWRARRRSS